MISTAARTMMVVTALAILTPAYARGQEPPVPPSLDVDAGVRAFLAADYGQAVDRLRPIAEHWTVPVDGTATFFMAMAYAEGLGVAQDAVRACALRQRALSATGVLALLSERLNTHAMATFSPGQVAECFMRSAAGFDLEFPHTTVTLAPGRWVDLDLSAQDAGGHGHDHHAGGRATSHGHRRLAGPPSDAGDAHGAAGGRAFARTSRLP